LRVVDPDHELRTAAHRRARELGQRFNDLVPVDVLREGFIYDGQRISFGSFYKGIHRPKEMRGPAALTLTTAARVPGKRAAYEDELDIENRAIVYHYRAGSIDQRITAHYAPLTSSRSRSSISTVFRQGNTWSFSRYSSRPMTPPGGLCCLRSVCRTKT
jgi:hypothetical protein